eukprot:Nitzschia sp. Nitz4//scaffold322_size40381//20503//22227//NITZ4_007563-RA/size40381-processed-gene-0.23-mRNA-1//-1//CDS//3329547836//1559//frame0
MATVASDNDSAASGTLNTGSPRRSLGEMLDAGAAAAAAAVGASGRGEDDVFSDMPSLSSYRADDLSQVTSTSHTSIASYSRGGDSRNEDDGDGDASLPSLSSIKPDELSTCSSLHPTNPGSDHSAELWDSVASGNVSAETDDSDEDATLTADRGPKKPSRGQKPGPTGSSRDGAAPNKESSLVNNAAPPRRASPPDDSDINPSIKRPTRRLSPPSNKQQIPPIPPSIISHESPEFSTPGGFDVRVPVRRTASASSMHRTPVERTGSFPLSQLKRPSQTENAASNADGSSSSLRGGDSLPRLPRRTSTVEVEMDAQIPRSLAAPRRYSDEGSRISDDTSRISEVNSRISDDVSLNSDLESDISIDTVDENEDLPPPTLTPVQPIHHTNQQDDNHNDRDQHPSPPVESVEANIHLPVPTTITPTLMEEPEQPPASPPEPPTPDPAPAPAPVEPDPVVAVPEEAEVVVTEKENETIPLSSDKPEDEDPPKKGNKKENGVSRAEESGTSATDTDDTDGGALKNGIKGKTASPSTRTEPSRGNLRKTISNSVKNSFRVVKRGVSKSASKLGSLLRKPES